MDMYIQQLKKLRRRIYTLRAFVPWLKEMHYLEKMVGPVGFWDKLQRYQFNFLKNMGLMPYQHLLDIGCGPLQGGLAFIKYLNPGNYFGLDYMENTIHIARHLINKNRLEDKKPNIFLSKTFGREELNGTKFDYIWASQVVYYFTPEMLSDLFEHISNVLKPEGKFYCDICDTADKNNSDNKFISMGMILHEIDDISSMSRQYGLHCRHLGKIRDLRYPKQLTMGINDMLEFSKTEKKRA